MRYARCVKNMEMKMLGMGMDGWGNVTAAMGVIFRICHAVAQCAIFFVRFSIKLKIKNSIFPPFLPLFAKNVFLCVCCCHTSKKQFFGGVANLKSQLVVSRECHRKKKQAKEEEDGNEQTAIKRREHTRRGGNGGMRVVGNDV